MGEDPCRSIGWNLQRRPLPCSVQNVYSKAGNVRWTEVGHGASCCRGGVVGVHQGGPARYPLYLVLYFKFYFFSYLTSSLQCIDVPANTVKTGTT
jgi:hypothetical protein